MDYIEKAITEYVKRSQDEYSDHSYLQRVFRKNGEDSLDPVERDTGSNDYKTFLI